MESEEILLVVTLMIIIGLIIYAILINFLIFN